jgi:ribosomal protein S27AE
VKSDGQNCFQCGEPVVLELTDQTVEADWFSCGKCGEKIMTVGEALARIRSGEEERVKQGLGFYDFKPRK